MCCLFKAVSSKPCIISLELKMCRLLPQLRVHSEGIIYLNSLTWCYHTPHPRAGSQGSRQPSGLELTAPIPFPADSPILPILTHPWWFWGSHLPAPSCPVLLQRAGPLRGLCTQIWFDFCSSCFLPWPWTVPYLTGASSLTHAELRIGYWQARSCLKLNLHSMVIVILHPSLLPVFKNWDQIKTSGFLQNGQAGSTGTGLEAAIPVRWDIAALFDDAHLFTVRCQPPFQFHYN